MGDADKNRSAFETLFSRTTGGHFLREFSFSSTKFTPPARKSEVELADFVIQVDDLFMVFQVKEREEPTTDPNMERAWFDDKVIKKATKQIRDTIGYLQMCPPAIANDRGRNIALPNDLDPASVLKVVVFKASEHLPVECARHRFHDSKTAGFIHVVAADDWANVMHTLVTPREIADYLRARERVCRAHVAASRSVSEKALVGQFIADEDSAKPAHGFESVVDRLIDDRDSFDMLGFLNLFGDRLTTDAPPGMYVPHDLQGAGSDYYRILVELAKLPRNDLAAFKTRFMLAWERAGKLYDPPFMRMTAASTGVGFVFAPVPMGQEIHAQNFLMNCIAAHLYDQRIGRCIGASFVNEGAHRFISWALVDRPWKHHPEMDGILRDNPISSVEQRLVPKYRVMKKG